MRLQAVRKRIDQAARAAGRSGAEVSLLAVSKTHPPTAVQGALAAGQRDFGENRVQELRAKAAALAGSPDCGVIRWHLIGSLQTNKVRDLLAVPGLVLLHSLDRSRLADELQRELARQDRSLDVLVQIHATDEATKHGAMPDEAPGLVDHVRQHCPRLRVVGVMAMGPAGGDPTAAFARVVAVRDTLRATTGLPLPILSLGMSGDLEAAIAAGSTLVRIGTAVFGDRPQA
ncbi:MAG: YggS family pyridoxal phosphate-dependent enzyme [Planctomycetes bacterium]|nr:YggS family pyridoxal phosphate-dependent enzyme [Planctomycetota bacterium]